MNKKGFTLVELLVYMAIVGIVVIVAGQAFGDSTKVRIRTQNMIKANKEAESVGALIRDDMAQMGAKVAKDAEGNVILWKAACMDTANGDFSSFNLKANAVKANNDSITFRRMAYDEERALRIEEVSWYVQSKKLYRSCKTIYGTEDPTYCPLSKVNAVEIASDVEEFVVTPAQPGLLGGNDTLFPVSELNKAFRFVQMSGNDSVVALSVSPEEGGVNITLSGFATNYRSEGNEASEGDVKNFYHQLFLKETGDDAADWKQCKKFKFAKDSTYEISFTMPFNEDHSRMFQAGKDHFAVGIRRVEGSHLLVLEDVPDFYFIPPISKDGVGERKMRFTPHTENIVDACVAFTFANYSPSVGAGSINISNVTVMKIAENNYSFTDSFRTSALDGRDKANVRAFQVRLKVKKNGEEGEAIITAPVPSNGAMEFGGSV